jgi:hypothetical protein
MICERCGADASSELDCMVEEWCHCNAWNLVVLMMPAGVRFVFPGLWLFNLEDDNQWLQEQVEHDQLNQLWLDVSSL